MNTVYNPCNFLNGFLKIEEITRIIIERWWGGGIGKIWSVGGGELVCLFNIMKKLFIIFKWTFRRLTYVLNADFPTSVIITRGVARVSGAKGQTRFRSP